MFAQIDWLTLPQLDWHSVDPLSFIVAALALWIALSDYWRNNYVIAKVIECRCSHPQNLDENDGQPFHYFQVFIRNYGLPLYGVRPVLSFNDMRGGLLSMPMKKAGEQNGTHDEFARGMVAEFYFKSYEMNETEQAFLSHLKSMWKQNTTLTLYSSGYLACDYRIGGIVDCCKSVWNKVAHKLNRPFKLAKAQDEWGGPIYKHYKPIPELVDISWGFGNFLKAVKRDEAKP